MRMWCEKHTKSLLSRYNLFHDSIIGTLYCSDTAPCFFHLHGRDTKRRENVGGEQEEKTRAV